MTSSLLDYFFLAPLLEMAVLLLWLEDCGCSYSPKFLLQCAHIFEDGT